MILFGPPDRKAVEAPSAPSLGPQAGILSAAEVLATASGVGGYAAVAGSVRALWALGLAAIRRAANVEPYLRADGTRIRSLMQLERQLRPEAYRRRGGHLDRRRIPAADAWSIRESVLTPYGAKCWCRSGQAGSNLLHAIYECTPERCCS